MVPWSATSLSKEGKDDLESTQKLLEARGEKYSNTWYTAGLIMSVVKEEFLGLLTNAPQYSHNWVLILSKLIRILFTPYEKDHWRDIIGYATLCLRDIESHEGVKDG